MKLNKEEEAMLTMLRSSEYLREDAPPRPFWFNWKWATGLLVFVGLTYMLAAAA